MKLYGLQKTTLLDYPGKVACTVFTAGCNFRCPFCHNASLINQNCEGNLSVSEFFKFLKKRQKTLDGVCITGGEPLIQPDITEFIKEIKALGFLVKLDTNGSRPKILKDLIDAGLLDYVAMDVKSSPEEYCKAAGVSDLDVIEIEKSINVLLNSGIDYEFRTTLVKQLHGKNIVIDIGNWLNGAKLYVLQKFEQSDDVLLGKYLQSIDDGEMSYYKSLLERRLKNVELRGV